MAKIKNPLQFSRHFNVSEQKMNQLGVLDPTLNVDAKLFIDPLLLPNSMHNEIKNAETTYKNFFSEIIKILSVSKAEGDLPWRTAYKKMMFTEINGTCLGYGAASIRGSGFGPLLSKKITNTAKEIIDLGITDPDLFLSLPLLEENIGPDLISDMVTNIIIENLMEFNARVLNELKVPTQSFKIKGKFYNLARNPKESSPAPVILVPKDILRQLPIANSWSEVCDNAAENDELREKVNRTIGEIWEAKTRKDKERIRESALSNRNTFSTILQMLHCIAPKHYDFSKDPDGILVWRQFLESVANDYPLKLDKPKSIEDVYQVVIKIIDQFQHLVEKRGLARELWNGAKRRNEKSIQRIFFAVADSYCEANNIDISPEIDTGTGQIDFKFSAGYDSRVLIEIKLSDNPKLVAGYEKQLEAYKGAEKTLKGLYVVIDVGSIGKKDQILFIKKNKQVDKGLPVSEIIFIDGIIKESASKLK